MDDASNEEASMDELSKEEAFIKFAEMQNKRLQEGLPPLSLMDLVDMYSEEDRRQIIRDTVKNKGLFYPINGRWELIDDPSIALPWALHEREPFGPNVLDVLERLLPSSKDQQERAHLAALLYRYRRKSGRDYLLKTLRDAGDPHAAVALALNREKEILEDLKRILHERAPNVEMIYALGRWGPETSSMLSEYLLRKGNPDFDSLWALSLADHRTDDDLRSLIEKTYEQGQGVIRVAAAAVLIRLDPENGQIIQYLIRLVENRDTAEAHLAVEALGRVQTEQISRLLRGIVESYISQDEAGYPDSASIEAAWNLAFRQDNEAKALTLEMLKKMIKNGVTDEQTLNTVGLAILESGLPDAEKEVGELLGAQLIETVRGTRKLNRLPVERLPVLSKKIFAKPYSIQ